MFYETMPLYPAMRGDCDGGRCVKVPVFDDDHGVQPCPGSMPELRAVRRVTIENPCRPGECAEVLLGLDACGNLVVCVRRDPGREPCRCLPPPCPPRPCRPPRPSGGCGRGRLYGTWR